MAAVEFAIDLTLDGDSYPAARGTLGERQSSVQYVPKIKLANMSPVGDATLDPIEYTTFHRGAGASRTVSVNGMVAYGENVWTVDPGLLMPGPEVTAVALTGATVAPRPDGVAEADGNVYVAAGRYVFCLSAGQELAPPPSQDADLGVGGVGYALKRFGTSLFLSHNNLSVTSLLERPDGGAWTSVLLGSNPVPPTGALATVFWTTGVSPSIITTERLIAQFGARGIRYCETNPRNDTSWTPGFGSPAIDVGAPITRFATSRDHLYIACTDGLRDLDSSGLAPNLLPEAEMGPLPTGGLAALTKSGTAYCSAGYDLYRVAVAGTQYAIGEPITPMTLLPNETPVAGYGTALLSRGSYLIYSQYDPINNVTWVMWGREASSGQLIGRMPGEAAGVEAIRGPELGPFVWNVAPIVLRGFKVTAMHITGLAPDGPRLWMFGQNNIGTVSAFWAPLAYSTPYGDLKSGRARRFATSCYVILPSEDGGDDAMNKDIEEVLVMSENLTGGNNVKVSAAKEGTSGSFTQLGTFTSGPRALVPVGAAFITERPTFRIDLSSAPTSPAITRRVSVRWLPNPDVREVRRYVLQLGRDERYGSGALSSRGSENQVAKLAALSRSGNRVRLVAEGGALIVRVLKIEGPSEVEAVETGSRVLSIAVTMSVFGVAAGPPFGYDAGVPWDSGRSWS